MSEVPTDGRDADLALAFPASVSESVGRVVELLPPARLKAIGSRDVQVDDERLSIPYRIYNAEPAAGLVSRLTPVERAVLDCVYTRHHNGFVRQAHMELVIGSEFPWVVPYVVALLGEYVEEIIASIANHLDLDSAHSPDRGRYGRFVATNPAFFEMTSCRVTSYWNCYYRSRYPAMNADDRFPRYPGFALIDKLRRAGTDAERSILSRDLHV